MIFKGDSMKSIVKYLLGNRYQTAMSMSIMISQIFMANQISYAAAPPDPNSPLVELTADQMPSVGFRVTFTRTNASYNYDYTSVTSPGNGLEYYENSNHNGTTNTWKEIFKAEDEEDLMYTFGSNDGDSNYITRFSTNTLYPPYSASCDTTNSYKPKNGYSGITVHTHDSDCITNSPYRPVNEHYTVDINPTPSGLRAGGMRAFNCKRASSWHTPYSSPGFFSLYSGFSESNENAVAGIFVSGIPSYTYYIEFDIYAYSHEDNILGSPQPINVNGSNTEGKRSQGSHVSGWFEGTESFYAITPNINSTCYEFGISNIRVSPIARSKA